jgi:tetratricopeptide (TPR) repeat protein
MAPGLPTDLLDRIADGAEGVPLYAVETVRMLVDRGLLVRDGTRLVAAGTIGPLEIPETLHALVASRLDALPEEERHLVGDAAVLGKTFGLEGLSAVSGTPVDELSPLLASLVRRELITLQTDPRSPERGQYSFVQAIVRTIAYETMSRRDRKRRHVASATHLERLGDELAEVVAAHYLDAYRLAPDDPDAGELRDTARSTLLKAADRATSLAAPAEALRLVRSALELSDEPQQRTALLERAGRLAYGAGDIELAEAIFGQAIELHTTLGNAHAAARNQAHRGEALFLFGRADEAVSEMGQAYAVIRDTEQDADLAWLAAQYGRLLGFVGRTDEGQEPIERAITIAESLALPRVISQALNTKGLRSLVMGRREEGISLLLGALRVALDHDEAVAAMRAYFNLSFAESAFDSPTHGYDNLGLALAERVGDRHWERSFRLHLAVSKYLLGEWDDALAHAGAAVTDATDLFVRSAYGTPIASIHALRGDFDAAWDALERSGGGRDVGDSQAIAMWSASEADVLKAERRFVEAAQAARVAADLVDDLGRGHPASKWGLAQFAETSAHAGHHDAARSATVQMETLAAASPLMRAQSLRIRALLGDVDDPAATLQQAAEILRSISHVWILAEVQEELAVMLANTDPARAEEAAAEARAIAVRLGMRPLIERLDALFAPDQAAAQL